MCWRYCMKRSLSDLPLVLSFQGFMISNNGENVMCAWHADIFLFTRWDLLPKPLVLFTSQNINKQHKSREIKKCELLHVLHLYQCCPNLISWGSLLMRHNNAGLEASLSAETECQVLVQSSALSSMATSSQIRAHCWYSARGSLHTGN